MALQYGLNNAVDFGSDRLMMFASVYNRTLGQPMDKTQLWYPLNGKTALERAKEYAASASAFVGQEIAVVDVTYEEDGTTVKSTKAKIYVIQDAEGNLEELGQASGIEADITGLDQRVQEIEKFFATADGETLDKALDTLIEIQQYVDEHGDVFFELRTDVDTIYQPWELNEDGSYKRDENGNRILAAKPTGALQDEIDRAIAAENVIYDADGKTVDGKPVATGLLPDEIAARIKAVADEAAARESADNIVYDADGGTNEDGTKYATGLLPGEIARAKQREHELDLAILNIYDPAGDKDNGGNNVATGVLVDEIKSVNDHIASLFKVEGEGENKEYSGEIVDYIVDAVPIATLERLGRVKSSEAENHVKVKEDGTMEVNSLNVMKLTQTEGDLLILDGGCATGITPKTTT